MITVKVKKLHPDAKLPTKGSPGAACWDVYALEDIILYSTGSKPVRTGLSFELPRGYEIEVRPRSGLSAKGFIIVNSPGTLDSDYRGELLILMKDSVFSTNTSSVKKGDRIAQIKVNEVPPVEFVEVEELSETERGSKGFGSTGR